MTTRRLLGAAMALPLTLMLAGFGRCSGSSWTLVWEDGFDGAAASAPDASKWGFDLGTGAGGWGNNEQQYYRAENAALDGQGHLVITAREEAYLGSAYTSARLLTKGKYAFTHGRVEARMKLPRGQGLWPAFWLLGANIDETSWPACGEIDIMEARGQLPNTTVGTLHGPGYSGANGLSAAYALPTGNLSDDFHVFAIEWDPAYVAWELDGVTYSVQTPAELPAGAPWVFDHPFFLILNVAVGGNFVGSPDATTVFPQTLEVDYVRVYEAGS